MQTAIRITIASLIASITASEATAEPNILLIYSDDIGYEALNCDCPQTGCAVDAQNDGWLTVHQRTKPPRGLHLPRHAKPFIASTA